MQKAKRAQRTALFLISKPTTEEGLLSAKAKTEQRSEWRRRKYEMSYAFSKNLPQAASFLYATIARKLIENKRKKHRASIGESFMEENLLVKSV